jgi:antitoxin component HigA of HigAB toxin-antitoxin module
MQVVEKTRRIKVNLSGEGADKVAALVKERFPDAVLLDDEGEAVVWKETALAQEIKTKKTPGKLIRAYRERAGMTLVGLANVAGTKYPNLSAIENDRRAVGLTMARKLGEVLGVDYRKFIE